MILEDLHWTDDAPLAVTRYLVTMRAKYELTYLLVSLDKHTAEQPGESWESYYARRIIDHFSPAGT